MLDIKYFSTELNKGMPFIRVIFHLLKIYMQLI